MQLLLEMMKHKHLNQKHRYHHPPEKIRPFDFRHPDKFLHSRLGELSNAFDDFIRKFQVFLQSQYDITAQIHLAGCDQFPFEEFFRTLPPPSPLCTFDWMGGSGAFQIAADVFFILR